MPGIASEKGAWYEHPHYRTVVKIISGIVLVLTFYTGVIKKDGDFRNHFVLGEEFLEKHPYHVSEDHPKPVCAHYPLGRLVLDVFLTVPPYRLSRAFNWVFALIGLVLSLRLWQRMSQTPGPPRGPTFFAAATLTLLITLRWLVRDLADCGQQLFLVWMLSAAGWWLIRGKSWLARGLLGLAVTYKATPLLFLPLLLYKRKWVAALSMGCAILLLNVVAPALFLGWPKTVEASSVFWEKAREISAETRMDPTANGVEPAKHQNRSLTSALARCLMTFESGHPLFIPHPRDVTDEAVSLERRRPHPLFLQLLDLSPRRASHVVSAALLVLALGLAYRSRRPWGVIVASGSFSAEWTGAMILCAILSPLCWGQHMVLLIPAVFLIISDHLSGGSPRRRTLMLCLIAGLILGPQRELIGRELWVILHSYKLGTIAALLILFLVLGLRRAFEKYDVLPDRDEPGDIGGPQKLGT